MRCRKIPTCLHLRTSKLRVAHIRRPCPSDSKVRVEFQACIASRKLHRIRDPCTLRKHTQTDVMDSILNSGNEAVVQYARSSLHFNMYLWLTSSLTDWPVCYYSVGQFQSFSRSLRFPNLVWPGEQKCCLRFFSPHERFDWFLGIV